MPQAAVIATLLPNAKSGIRESNPPPRLGKPMHYRCANAANNFRCKGSKNIARMQIFCLKVQKKMTTPLLMGSRQATSHKKKTTISRLFWVTSGARTHDWASPLCNFSTYCYRICYNYFFTLSLYVMVGLVSDFCEGYITKLYNTQVRTSITKYCVSVR